MNDHHVVLGTGSLGLAVVGELREDGERVTAVNRSGDAPVPAEVDVRTADLSDASRARSACEDADVVYFCVNPPYTKWPALFPPLLENTIESAAAVDATLVVADNLYGYGPVEGPLTEDLPADATGHKGRTRAEMARTVLAAHEDGRLDATIGRASDFYGPRVMQSAVGERVFASALAGTSINVLGDPDAPHTYTFIDDFARGLVTLASHDEAMGEAWHVPSAETLTTRAFVERVREAPGSDSSVRSMPSWLYRVVSTVHAEMRELRETIYTFEDPLVVDHSKFEAAFGADPTPHDEAIVRTLEWYRSADTV